MGGPAGVRKSNIWRADRDQCSRADEQLRSEKGVARAAWRRREVGGQGPIRSEEERKEATDGQTESETAGERLCRIKRVRNSSNSTLCRWSVLPPRSVQRRARSPEYVRWRQFKVAAASCGGEASREALSKAGSHFHPSNCGWPHRTAGGRTHGRRTRTEEDVVTPGSARPPRRPSVPPSVGRSVGG